MSKYQALIRVNGKVTAFGSYPTKAERDEAVTAARYRLGGTCKEAGCTEPGALRADAFGRCKAHLARHSKRQRGGGVPGSNRGPRDETATREALMAARGWNPETGTYDATPTPAARLDITSQYDGWLDDTSTGLADDREDGGW